MDVLLKDQICEWADSELGPRAMEFARKWCSEDALQDKLADFLKKGGEKPSPYEDINHLHRVIIQATKNHSIDILRSYSRRRHVEESAGCWRELEVVVSDSSVEEGHGEKAAGVLRSAILELEPLDRIVLLIDREITGRDVISDVRLSSMIIIFDPDMLGLVQDAAAKLEPPVSASEAGAWTTLEEVAGSLRQSAGTLRSRKPTLEEVAGSLRQSAGTLRSRKHRVYAKLQRSLEDRGVSFKQWNQFGFDR